MAGDNYDSVPVRVERHDDQGVFKIGVVLDGAFITFSSVKTGTVEELVQRAKDKAAAEPKSAEPELEPEPDTQT